MKWKAALYGRVSTDHEEQQDSIRTQKEALMQYASDNGFEIIGYYFDEGYTGTSFDRPEFNRLRYDIENNKINMVIVKDLSRIGRNNPLTLLFLDYLSDNSVRLIAVNDNYDTLKDCDDLIGIKTWFNERYSKELSQKIKFALKHKKRKGEYLTAFAPYGYKKSSEHRNRLEVDVFAADVVKEIFRLYINGFGFSKIAGVLQERGIPNPSRYGLYGRKSDKWDWTTIKKIISNPVYLGHSVQQKYRRKNFKCRTISMAPESEWIIAENTHKPIIEKYVYDLAQQILNKRKDRMKYRCGPGKPHLFTSFIYCHECGYPLYYKKDKNGAGVYRCGQYIRYGKKFCTSHFIRESELIGVIGSELENAINKHIDKELLVKEIIEESRLDYGSDIQLQDIDNQIEKNKNKIEILYRDKLNGLISKELFEKLMQETECVSSGLEKSKSYIMHNKVCKRDHEAVKVQILNEMSSIVMPDEIDRATLEWFITRIEICENRDVILEFNFFEL